ncbi:hypothetical protein TWF694_011408 [Orbilia ellipsospora]|uniref:LRAT domain-containing protein n=1 Tax=Orbilia ellipsospora TaxID=2528407 RepID=A0AAV9X5E2_9PEZI
MVRTVYLIQRPLQSSAHKYENGRFVSSGSSRSSGNSPTIPVVSRLTGKANHWALKVGSYTHELFTTGDETGDIIYNCSIWDDDECASIVTNVDVGMSFYSDDDIKDFGDAVIRDMRAEGKYDTVANNCQEFVHRLGKKIILDYDKSKLNNQRSVKGTMYRAAAGAAYLAFKWLTHDPSKPPQYGGGNNTWKLFDDMSTVARKANNGY